MTEPNAIVCALQILYAGILDYLEVRMYKIYQQFVVLKLNCHMLINYALILLTCDSNKGIL